MSGAMPAPRAAVPPQVLAAMMAQGGPAAAQGGTPAAPAGVPGQQTPALQQPSPASPLAGAAPLAAPRMPPPGFEMFGRAARAGHGAPLKPGQMRLSPEEMAHAGRFGDTVMAHLTPGEIEVPPQVQTPQLMQAIHAAFAQAGINPAQFTAGSPDASRNPRTGQQEFSFLGGILGPILSGLGAVFAPELLPAMAPGIAGAIGGGLGGLAGSALGGGNIQQDLLGALGGAGGGYLGGLGGGASNATPTSLAPTPGSDAANFSEFGSVPTVSGPTMSAASTPLGSPGAGTGILSHLFGKQAMMAAMGAGLGGALAPDTPNPNAQLPTGFNNSLPPVNPNFNSLLGSPNASAVNFGGYDPYQAALGGMPNLYRPAG